MLAGQTLLTSINLSQFQAQIQEAIVVKYFGGDLEVAVQPRPKRLF